MLDDAEPWDSSDPDEVDSLMREAASAPDAPMLAVVPGMLVHGKYRILALLGRGGMGEVWRANDTRLGRTVAIKFQHGATTDVDRMRREARALAALSHPNVVTVLEVGVYEGTTFIAMEWIDGGDARNWARRAPRSWQEIITVYRAAGRGLAAAHEVGIVHRDFKPDNVLVGEQRVCVADFGIARIDVDGVVAPAEIPAAASNEHGRRHTQPGRGGRTRSDGFLGTPAYMAPEQLRTARVDARADQYSFCAAIYEALYAELPRRPNASDATASGTTHAVGSGPADVVVPAPARSDRAPRWLLRVLQRGLAPLPDARFSSMTELLAALDSTRRQRWIAPTGVGALAIVGLAVFAGASPRRPTCVEDANLAAHWTHDRAATIARHLRETGTVANEASVRGLVARLDENAAAWVRSWSSACADTEAPGFDAGLVCLREQRNRFVATLDLLEHADATTAANAASLGEALEDPHDCLDERPRTSPPPGEIAPEVERLDAVLARVDAGITAGAYREAEALLEPILRDVHALGHRPSIARALRLRGMIEIRRERFTEAYADLSDAYMIALSDRMDDLARDLASLVAIALASEGRFDQALLWAEHVKGLFDGSPGQARPRTRLALAQAKVLAALGRFPEAEAALDDAAAFAAEDPGGNVRLDVLAARANLSYGTGNFEQAIALERELLAALEPKLGGDHVLVGRSLENLGSYELQGDHRAEARVHLTRALAVFERAFGPDDPALIQVLVEIGHLDTIEGAPAVGLPKLVRAREIAVAAGRSPDPVIAQADDIIGIALTDLGRIDEAIEVFRTELDTLERSRGADDPELRFVLNNMGTAATRIGRDRDAEQWLRRAIAIDDGLVAHDFESTTLHANLGFALLERDAIADARAEFETALRIGATANRPDDPDLAYAHQGLGLTLRASGNTADAAFRFERAIDLWDKGTNAAGFAALRRELALTLWAEGRDRARALELARAGLAEDPDDEALGKLVASAGRIHELP